MNPGEKIKEWAERTKQFYLEVRSEMRKVSWPGRQEVFSEPVTDQGIEVLELGGQCRGSGGLFQSGGFNPAAEIRPCTYEFEVPCAPYHNSSE